MRGTVSSAEYTLPQTVDRGPVANATIPLKPIITSMEICIGGIAIEPASMRWSYHLFPLASLNSTRFHLSVSFNKKSGLLSDTMLTTSHIYSLISCYSLLIHFVLWLALRLNSAFSFIFSKTKSLSASHFLSN